MEKKRLNILILAAGFGTRLKEAGEELPKGLVKTGSNTLLGRVLDEISDKDFYQDVALITNNRDFKAYHSYLSSYSQPHVTLLNNGVDSPEKRLGALKDLELALDLLDWHDSDLLVLPSDTYYRFSLAEFVSFIQGFNEFGTVFREFTQPQEEIANRLGCAVIEDNRVVEFIEKPEDPPSPYGAVPIYYYPEKTLRLLSGYIEIGEPTDAPGSIIPWLLENGHPVYAYITNHITHDVGTPSDLSLVKNL